MIIEITHQETEEGKYIWNVWDGPDLKTNGWKHCDTLSECLEGIIEWRDSNAPHYI